MSEQRDSYLQSLFAEADNPLVDKTFTNGVMKETKKREFIRYSIGVIVFAIALLIASQFLQPLQSTALLITDILSTELFDLGDSNVAWFLVPVNNLATLALLIARGLRMSLKRMRQDSFAN